MNLSKATRASSFDVGCRTVGAHHDWRVTLRWRSRVAAPPNKQGAKTRPLARLRPWRCGIEPRRSPITSFAAIASSTTCPRW